METTIDQQNELDSEESLGYAVTIGENLHQRIDNHLYLMKNLGKKNFTKQQWLLNALQEKLAQDETLVSVPKERHIQIKVDHTTRKQLESRVDFIRNFRRSYSKKQLILEAIYEKLDREEEISKNLLLNLKTSEK